MIISPSIYAADIFQLQNQLKEIEENNVEMLHVDIMDGHFVKNIALGQAYLQQLRASTKLLLDVHLMVDQPETIIDSIIEAGADIITIHAESTSKLKWILQHIRKQGIQTGVALNPETPPSVLQYVLNDIDLVLVMTVNPGEGNQTFMKDMLYKIKELRPMLLETSIKISVDGSVDNYWAGKCADVGANIFVSGSYIFKGNITEQLKEMKKHISKERKD